MYVGFLISNTIRQECFNSPYGHQHFPKYAETIGYEHGKPYDIEKSESESVKALSDLAKQTGVWLLGGERPYFYYYTGVGNHACCTQDLFQSEMNQMESCIIQQLYTIRKVSTNTSAFGARSIFYGLS